MTKHKKLSVTSAAGIALVTALFASACAIDTDPAPAPAPEPGVEQETPGDDMGTDDTGTDGTEDTETE